MCVALSMSIGPESGPAEHRLFECSVLCGSGLLGVASFCASFLGVSGICLDSARWPGELVPPRASLLVL